MNIFLRGVIIITMMCYITNIYSYNINEVELKKKVKEYKELYERDVNEIISKSIENQSKTKQGIVSLLNQGKEKVERFQQYTEEIINSQDDNKLPRGRCNSLNVIDSDMKGEENGEFVLMSLTVPKNIWRSLSYELKSSQGKFVLRGIPDGSFKKLQEKIMELRQEGVDVPILIDPRIFKEYGVKMVPCFLLKDKVGRIHKIVGGISLTRARELCYNKP